MIFTSISPNTEADDVWLAIGQAFIPWTWKKGPYVSKLEKAFQEKFNVQHTFAFQSGRNSLYALLIALDLKSQDEVLLQAYTCVAVPEPVLWVGAKPVYVDVKDDLTIDPEDLKKKITSKSKVLIIQHTFGMPAHIDELLAIAREHNLFIIEDCAHAMGAKYKGKYVGTFGDASFFSFGRDKVLSSVFGGMLIVQDAAIAEKVKVVRETFTYQSHTSIKNQIQHPVITSFAKLTYNILWIGKIVMAISVKIGLISKAVQYKEYSGGKPSFVSQKMPNVLARLAFKQFGKLDRYNTYREKIAALYKKELFTFAAEKYVEDTNPIWLRYTLFVNNPRELILKARKQGIELGDWYQNAIAPKKVVYEKIGYNPATCPNAEKFALQSVNLPTSIQTSEKDAKKVIQFIKSHGR